MSPNQTAIFPGSLNFQVMLALVIICIVYISLVVNFAFSLPHVTERMSCADQEMNLLFLPY